MNQLPPQEENQTGLEIAVIGMSLRFPGATHVSQFLENLNAGHESIQFFSATQSLEAGVDPQLVANPGYVAAKGSLERAEYFDAGFFGYTPAEATVMDPQIRLFHQCAWETLEDAGYDPGSYDGQIGLYGGASANMIWMLSVMFAGNTVGLDHFSQQQLLNKDNITMRVSYNLNLKGPSYSLNTACSTSLTAIHIACQALLSGECHMALAGGVTVMYPLVSGYVYQEGMVGSPDGHCRAFDAAARGIVGGDGCGLVALKLLEDALHDHDVIHAVIKGSAINNDGKRKTGYTAPSIKGQMQVIQAAQKMAGVKAETIGYIEAHGTATLLGDPIEIEALKQAFATDKRHFCGIGSVKTNVGHLDSAAGVAGFIKAVLSIQHKILFPSLHYKTPNPKIDFEHSPFFVPVEPSPWRTTGGPLRAGVSSFGIGGTNAHVILEEAPKQGVYSPTTSSLVLFSARSQKALANMTTRWVDHATHHPDLALADVAYTLQVGRAGFKYRSFTVADTLAETKTAFTTGVAKDRCFRANEKCPVIFMFPGVGSQYLRMGQDLYRQERVFREAMDQCFGLLFPLLGLDIKEVLYPATGDGEVVWDAEQAAAILFTVEYGLAQLLLSWGIVPHAMMGYSFGEYTVAAVAGVMSLQDVLTAIVTRGKLIKSLPTGGMTSVPLPVTELAPLLAAREGVWIAIDNGAACIVSGTLERIVALETSLKERRLLCMRVSGVTHALHSPAMNPMVEAFGATMATLSYSEPEFPYISNVSGDWMDATEVKNPRYWCQHLAGTVQFDRGLRELLKIPGALFVEVGPGRDLSTMVKRYLDELQRNHTDSTAQVINLVRGPLQKENDHHFLLNRLGYLWCWGVKVDWAGFYGANRPYRVSLPTYPFEEQHYAIEGMKRLGALTRAIIQGMASGEVPESGATTLNTKTSAPEAPVVRQARFIERDGPYVAPETELEITMAGIWENYFGLRPISMEDDFLELGGDSLKAMNMANLIREELGVDIPVAEFFHRLTVKELARYVEENGVPEAGQGRTHGLQPVEKRQYYPLSAAQERLFVLAQMTLQDTSYNEYLVVKLEGRLDREVFGRVFQQLVERHESLRTGFILHDEAPVQVIEDTLEFGVQEVEVEGVAVEGVIRSFIRPFDLSVPSLLRVGLVRVAAESHVVVMDMHHIISDGTSQAILVRDFMSLYSGVALPPLRIQYKEYCMHQKQRQEDLEKQAHYWLTRFAGEIPVLNLPLDYPRPVEMEFAGGEVMVQWEEQESAIIKELARQLGTTLYMVLSAGYAILLSKLSGQEDIVMGTPTAGRRFAELHPVFGMFVNTLALRSFPSGQKRVKDFLAEVSGDTLQAFENQDYQLEELVERVVQTRDISRNPLFDTMMILQNMDVPHLEMAGLTLGPYAFERQVTKFDLTLTAYEREGRILLALEHRIHLFKSETARRFLRYYTLAMLALAANPDQTISQIDMVPEDEKALLLFRYNDTTTDFPTAKTIHGLFMEQAEHNPDHIALIGQSASIRATVGASPRGCPGLAPCQISYSQLNNQTHHIAASLIAQGIGPNHIVAVQLPRGNEFIIAILAVLKTGAAYLPIDPKLPEERIQYMLKDSGAMIIVTEKWMDDVQAFVQTRATTGGRTTTGGCPYNRCPMVGDGKNLAYIIYTSGSTGRPKGVVIRHFSLVNYIYAIYQRYDYTISAQDRCLSVAAITFDVSVSEIFLALLAGASLMMLPEERLFDVDKLCQTLVERAITFAYIPPALLKEVSSRLLLLAAGTVALNKLYVGVEPIPDAVLQDFFKIKPTLSILNIYGPTEVTVVATAGLYVSGAVTGAIIPIGKPLANYGVYILDSFLNPVPLGVSGELCVAGLGLALGYLNDPEKTAAKFISHRVEGTSGDLRLYRTGDLACWLPDGQIQFQGRLDDQVKIRGYRIEPGEIRTLLQAAPGIKQAVVTVKQTDEKVLCAYVVPQDRASFNEAEAIPALREYLLRTLPEYMVPSYIFALPAIPLTRHGKTDYRALPEPGQVRGSREHTPPRTPLEKTLVAFWQEVLVQSQVGIDDNFFQLGGHSLRATRLTAKIHKTLGVAVPLTVIFKQPTIRGLSHYLEEATGTLFQAIEAVEKREYYACSPAQGRMFVLQQMEPSSTVYNIPVVLVLAGKLNFPLFTTAFERVIQRQESLRTSFHLVDGQAVQVIHATVPFVVERYGLEANGLVPSLVKTFIRPFDLAVAPLWRVGLAELAEEKTLLMVDVHHIVSDGVSTDILIRDFSAYYTSAEPPVLKLQYKDIAHWQRGPQRVAQLKQQELYWLGVYSSATDIPVLPLPYDYPRPAIQSNAGTTVSFELESAASVALNHLAVSHHVTLYMTLMAVFSSLLARLSGREDMVIGSPSAGRVHEDMEGVMGMFINTLAIRFQPQGELTFAAYLTQVKEHTLLAFENQEYPFEELVERVALKRDASRNPLFDVMLVLQNMDIRRLDLSGITLSGFPFEPGVARFDITLTCSESPAGLGFIVEYCTALFKPTFIQRFIHYFKNMVASVVENPTQPLGQIPILTPEEQHQLLFTFNDTAADYPMDQTIHGLFTEQSQRTPDHIALIGQSASIRATVGAPPRGCPDLAPSVNRGCPDLAPCQITYSQLNKQSTQISNYLIQRGVLPDHIVAIKIQRSIEMVIGIIGILKAGAAYMPIDPDYPMARQEFMLADSGVDVIVTENTIVEAVQENLVGVLEPVLAFEETRATTGGCPYGCPIVGDGNNVGYVIYTSGTTGKPKGTLIEHRHVVRLMFNSRFQFQFDHRDRWSLFHSFCFDFSVWEMYGALLRGGVLVLVSNATARDPQLFLRVVIEQQVTVLNQTPAAFYTLAAEALNQGAPAHHLRYVIFGGDALKPAHLLAWHQKYPHTHLINMYGITETTVHVTFKAIGAPELASNLSNIGVPIPTLSVCIVNRFLELLPIGVPGELLVGGAGVARGYLNRPELTQERFIEKQFLNQTQRYYRSGDLARWLPTGEMEYLGRIDQQVKIRGFRVELGEIESSLLAHPQVKEAVVLHRVGAVDSLLCAYFVPLPGSETQPMATMLREYLAASLASYMVPSFFIPLERIPLTPNGKVDRRALPAPEVGELAAETYRAPVNKIQSILVAVWSEVLGVAPESIGVDSDFFELGGHSLKAIQVINGIHKQLQVRLPVQTMFQFPTVAQLAGEITRQELTPFIAIPKQPDRRYYELSYAQKRLWILQSRHPQSAVFNMAETTPLPRFFRHELLVPVVQRLMDRHESLRTSFRVLEGEVVQYIEPAGTVFPVLRTIDLSDLEGEALQQKRAQVIYEEGQTLFSLDRAPLLRLCLVRCGDEETYLVFTMYHLISDGWSLAIVQREFLAIYNALATDSEPGLSPLYLQYRDYAVWHNKLVENTEAIKPAMLFWQSRLQGVLPVLELPYDAAESTRLTARSAGYRWVITAEVAGLLRELAAQHHTSLFTLLLAGFNLLLAFLRDQRDILLALPGAARPHEDLKEMIGMFVNTLILRTEIHEAETFADFLKRVNTDAMQVLDYQVFPMELIFDLLGITYPNVSVFFNFQNTGESQFQILEDLESHFVESVQEAKFDLVFYVMEFKNGINIMCNYFKELFDPPTIEKIAALYTSILTQIAQDPHKPVLQYKTTGKRKKIQRG